MRRTDSHIHSRRRSVTDMVAERERRAGHPDWRCRAELLEEVDLMIDDIGLTRDQACLATAILSGGLDDASLATARLHEVLATLQQWPPGEILFRRLVAA